MTNSAEFEADSCEWAPETGRPATAHDPHHADATVSLGNGEWHLCSACAALPAFARFTERKPIRQAGGTV